MLDFGRSPKADHTRRCLAYALFAGNVSRSPTNDNRGIYFGVYLIHPSRRMVNLGREVESGGLVNLGVMAMSVFRWGSWLNREPPGKIRARPDSWAYCWGGAEAGGRPGFSRFPCHPIWFQSSAACLQSHLCAAVVAPFPPQFFDRPHSASAWSTTS
jgi:hypothetical protein